MQEKLEGSAGEGLEGSCGDWVRSGVTAEGVEFFEARFGGHAFDKHRHDTYAIGLTKSGVQSFNYRGALRNSTAGKVIVLHPDEFHDGHSGSDRSFSYKMLYIEPARIAAAQRAVCGRPCALPFAREVVSTNDRLSSAVLDAFRDDPEPLALDSLVVRLAEGLMAADPSAPQPLQSGRLDEAGLERTRQFLEAETGRVVHSAELETVIGLTRYDLSRQFRKIYGTSPYRYSLMRRLSFAKDRLTEGASLAELALDAGFSDQAHFTRMFKAAYGVTPARYGRLRAD